MKTLRPEHYAALRDMLRPHFSPERLAAYLEADETAERYRWDLLHKAGAFTWVCTTLYYLRDSAPVDAALASIVAEFLICGTEDEDEDEDEDDAA